MYRRTVLVALLLALALPTAGVAVADAGSPTISLRLDGQSVGDGGAIRTNTNPNVAVTVTAPERIDVVAVRIDGATRRTFTPNATRADYVFSPDLTSGDHTLTVVATANATETVEATVTKDAHAPEITFTAPFVRERGTATPDRVVLSNASVTLAGRVFDQSRVGRIHVERTYSYDGETDREQYDVPVDGTFSVPLFLGYGTNVVTVTVRDELGNGRTYRVALVVRDDEAPTLTVTDVEWVSPSTVRVRGEASDDVQLKSVVVGKPEVNNQRVVVATEDRRPDRSGRHVEFTGLVTPPEGPLLVSATDHSGKTTTHGVPIARVTSPDVRLDDVRRRDGTVVVDGAVVGGGATDVTVETASNATGELADVAVAYHGDPTKMRIPFGERLAAADGPTIVRVRVVDATGTERVVRRIVGGATTAESTPATNAAENGTPEATPRATGTAGPARTTASAPPRTENVTAGTGEAKPGIRLDLPVVGVVSVPRPSALGFSFSVPLTGVSVDVPGVGVGGALLLSLLAGAGVVFR